ncbi:thiolase family protein [Pseudodonghicola flavimaris]|uniref:Thiolase family protein n=1 Tax=Pseudodonghicola flavimaris TaxID=3050036 RepID=A0ABT7F205_9RHOB|nr:thiolase family protein [Pseudodonghicola flavimaris]MDK3018636.1 thiolase family protein [Pseudodonghicola flavimaris]
MSWIAEIPYGAYWSTPFAKWQGSFAGLHSIEFAAHVARRELAARDIAPERIDYGVLGTSVPQKGSFYGLPWLTGMIGAGHVGGPTISQACATGARIIQAGAQEIQAGGADVVLAVAADRTSNGPHLYYPAPAGPGGTGVAENWVLDNFNHDPLGGHPMLETAENVARKYGIGTEEQHALVLQRSAQYQAACADDHAFHRRYMSLPFEVPKPGFAAVSHRLTGDEGVIPGDAAKLRALKPVQRGGTVTYGGQTHPADGSAGMILTTPARAAELSRDPAIRIRLLGFGLARTELAHMPEAPVRAAARALQAAGLEIGAIDAVTSHNPFAVNDIVFARETGFDPGRMNAFGCSLIWGHPQAPTGLRATIELIEELALRGGGHGLFQGCAAGDTAMALVLKVGA